MTKEKIICSACLMGIKCRYDGTDKRNDRIKNANKNKDLIPVCPEQLGGLATPREPVELKNGLAITKTGQDVTLQFKKGAREVLRMAQRNNATKAILKQNSPSCGYGQIYDGSFTNKKIAGNGITAHLLYQNGIKIITEEDV